MTEDVLAEIMCIKDLYICGRMNLDIYGSMGNTSKTTSEAKREQYKRISESYVRDSIQELLDRRDNLNNEKVDVILDTSYTDFDEDLINDMMVDAYGGKDGISFATSYNYYAEDFNSLMLEFCV